MNFLSFVPRNNDTAGAFLAPALLFALKQYRYAVYSITSGNPFNASSTVNRPDNKVADNTTPQLTSVINAVDPSVAIAVSAIVLIALIAAAFNHFLLKYKTPLSHFFQIIDSMVCSLYVR